MASHGKFFYFGYGSNLLRERLQLLNPSAIFKDIAKLKDHKLTFNFSNEPADRSKLNWSGCPANIVAEKESSLWGVVWELSNSDIPHLDMQEGVETGIYTPIEVTVETPANEKLTCRAYKLLKNGNGDNRPSPQYIDVILRGALQNNLPEEYVNFLKSIEHNNYSGKVKVYEDVLKSISKEKNL